MAIEIATYPSLKNRVVLITGGGGGIGSALTRRFAEQGAKVGFLDIADEPSRALEAELKAAGLTVVYKHCDLRDIAALRAGIAALRETLGPIEILLNNAAHDQRHETPEVTPEYFDERIAVNLKHQFFAAQAVLPDMQAAQKGCIINFGSLSWMVGQGGMAVYTAAKSAVLGLTRSLARDYGKDNIRVLSVAPGWIMTERQLALWMTPEGDKERLERQCLKRPLVPDDVARATLFFASDEAGAMTNQSYLVDGAGSDPMRRAAFIAVDWGTTRLRAYLIDAEGQVRDRMSASDSGIQSVPAGGFPAALEAACGPWFADHPACPVIMAGMVGSRNGWAEASYVAPPCGPEDLAAALLRVADPDRRIFIIPGIDCRADDGSYDVMRGEETQAIGLDLADGLVCLPGTHSKWVEIAGGRITRFATFVTGELYAAVTQSFLGRLAQDPDDATAGAAIASRTADLPGGLMRALFQARSQVLSGQMSGHAVRPYLSHLLIETEVRGALDLFGRDRPVRLVAGDPQRTPYAAALERQAIAFQIAEPEATTVAGLVRLARLAGLDRTA